MKALGLPLLYYVHENYISWFSKHGDLVIKPIMQTGISSRN
jgi:hypothetical protein